MKRVIFILSILTVAITFAACSDSKGSSNETNIVGTWISETKTLATNKPGSTERINGYLQTCTFIREVNDTRKEYRLIVRDNATGRELSGELYEYEIKGDIIYGNSPAKEITEKFMIQDGKLTIIQKMYHKEIGDLLLLLGVGTPETEPIDIEGSLRVVSRKE